MITILGNITVNDSEYTIFKLKRTYYVILTGNYSETLEEIKDWVVMQIGYRMCYCNLWHGRDKEYRIRFRNKLDGVQERYLYCYKIATSDLALMEWRSSL